MFSRTRIIINLAFLLSLFHKNLILEFAIKSDDVLIKQIADINKIEEHFRSVFYFVLGNHLNNGNI